MGKEPCERVTDIKTETKMDDIKVGRSQCVKTWSSVVANEDYML